jgi:hypothetical protein
MQRMFCIEVCQGPDCTGLGGGAALLEIEELVQEEEEQEAKDQERHDDSGSAQLLLDPIQYQVEAGGCRNFCTVGPNVHISYKRSNILLESFHHVKDASSCRQVMKCAVDTSITTTRTQRHANQRDQKPPFDKGHEIIAHETMMSRRIERKRWEALRNVSRAAAKFKKYVSEGNTTCGKAAKWNKTCADHLAPVTHMEVSAAKSIESKDRAMRRNERMLQNVNEKLENYVKEQDL